MSMLEPLTLHDIIAKPFMAKKKTTPFYDWFATGNPVTNISLLYYNELYSNRQLQCRYLH